MKIFEKFKELSLAKQLQLLFTISSSVLIICLIVISYYLIFWLREHLTEKTTDLIDSKQEGELIRLMQLNAQAISTEFSYYLALPKYLSRQHNNICEGRYPLSKGSGTFNETEAKSSNIGVFYTKNEISSLGKELVSNESTLDVIMPFLKSKNLSPIYLGFEIDELFHIYPPVQMPEVYTPSIREWYYTAKNSTGVPIFTEPYQDFRTKEWVISACHSISCYNSFIGVSAADVTLKSLRSRLSSNSVSSSWFFMLVSASGIIVTMPSTWLGETARLNDTELTGFSSSEWLQVIDEETEISHKYKFTDQNKSQLYCYRSLIKPSGQNKTTHFLFICEKEGVQNIFKQKPSEIFKKTNNVIFWIVLGISFGVFFGTVAIIFWISKKITVEMEFLVRCINSICGKSIFPDCTSFVKIVPNDEKINFFGLIPKGIEKVRNLQNKEREFANFTWGVTRPNDKFLFNRWEEKKYPKNYSSCVQIKWRDLFVELIRRTFHSGHFD